MQWPLHMSRQEMCWHSILGMSIAAPGIVVGLFNLED